MRYDYIYGPQLKKTPFMIIRANIGISATLASRGFCITTMLQEAFCEFFTRNASEDKKYRLEVYNLFNHAVSVLNFSLMLFFWVWLYASSWFPYPVPVVFYNLENYTWRKELQTYTNPLPNLVIIEEITKPGCHRYE